MACMVLLPPRRPCCHAPSSLPSPPSPQAAQGELGKVAQDFRRLHAERAELLAQWEAVAEAVRRRDADILAAGEMASFLFAACVRCACAWALLRGSVNLSREGMAPSAPMHLTAMLVHPSCPLQARRWRSARRGWRACSWSCRRRWRSWMPRWRQVGWAGVAAAGRICALSKMGKLC